VDLRHGRISLCGLAWILCLFGVLYCICEFWCVFCVGGCVSALIFCKVAVKRDEFCSFVCVFLHNVFGKRRGVFFGVVFCMGGCKMWLA
jgi:hypothetical protein